MVAGKDVQFYGAVTVSKRGQIVIPTQARRNLNIEVGEKLLVVGGPGGGLMFVKTDIVSRVLAQWARLARQLEEKGLADLSASGTAEKV